MSAPRLTFTTTGATPPSAYVPPPDQFIIRSAEGYYAGPIGDHIADHVAPPRWVQDPGKAWAYGSEAAALELIENRGWPPGFAEVVPAEPPWEEIVSISYPDSEERSR